MADEALRKIIEGESDTTTSEESKPIEELSSEEQAIKAKEEQLANLDKAVQEAQDKLHKIRKDTKKAKTGETASEDQEELPKIDLDDPSAKAWDRHIRQNTEPIRQESEQEKQEILKFTLKEFLSDKPALAQDPQKLEAVMRMYDRIKESSGRTREGVLIDLDKAYAAEHYDQLLSESRNRRIEQARNDAAFAEPGISRGATAYSDRASIEKITLSEDQRAQLQKWGMSPQEWIDMKKKYG